MTKHNLPPLATLRGFEAAGRHLSFSNAAEELCVTQGAVSRQVRQLEEHLQVPLFRRYTRRIELTDAGEELLLVVTDLFDRLVSVTDRLQRRANIGMLTVSVLPSIASVWLMPRLHQFTEQHPDIEVRLHTSIDPVVFTSTGPDLAIRVGRVPGWHYERRQPRIEREMTDHWRGIHADVLMPDKLVPVCSAGLLESGTRPTPKEMARMPLIHTTSRRFAWPDWLRAHGAPPPKDRDGDLELGHFFMSVQAARQGRGIALVPDMIVREDIEGGTLIVPYESELSSAGHYCLLMPDNHLGDPTITKFREWLLALIEPGENIQDHGRASRG